MHRALLAAGCALLVAGCGGGRTVATGTPSPSPSASPSPAPTSTPTPAPDTETVEVLATGVGAAGLTAYPVALLQNVASGHTATQVVAHFTVHSPSGAFAIDTSETPVTLTPGQVMAVAADCYHTCDRATSTDVSVSVGPWLSGAGPTITASTAVLSPARWGSPGYTLDASATLTGTVEADAAVDVFAACRSTAGVIVGGGVVTRVWPGGASMDVEVPVDASSEPASCQVYAAAAS